METACRINDHVVGGKLHGVSAVDIGDYQLAAVVGFRRAQKKRGGNIGANPIRRAGNLPDGIVQMRSKSLATFVAVEPRRKDP